MENMDEVKSGNPSSEYLSMLSTLFTLSSDGAIPDGKPKSCNSLSLLAETASQSDSPPDLVGIDDDSDDSEDNPLGDDEDDSGMVIVEQDSTLKIP